LLQSGQHAQHLAFRAFVSATTGLGFYGRGTVPCHGLQIGAGPCLQPLARAGANGAGGLALVDGWAAERKSQMRVAIHESGDHHSPDGADFYRLARLRQIFDAPRRPYLNQHSVANQERAVRNHAQLV
jgi:hypothetical protein